MNDSDLVEFRRTMVPTPEMTVTPSDDFTRLLNGILTGEDSAIDELIRDHRGLVVHAIRTALNPGHRLRPFLTTNDIIQEVQLRLHRAVSRGPGVIENGYRFILTIAVRLVIDYSRRLPAGRQCSLDDDLEAALADPSAGPETLAERSDGLRRLLDHFSAADRAILTARAAGSTWAEAEGKANGPAQRRIQRQIRGFLNQNPGGE